MEGNIQNIKTNKEKIKDLWYILIWLPVFALAWYFAIKAVISGIEVILYPVELTPITLIIKLLIAVLDIILIFMVLGGISFYYDVIKKLIKAHKIAHNKL